MNKQHKQQDIDSDHQPDNAVAEEEQLSEEALSEVAGGGLGGMIEGIQYGGKYASRTARTLGSGTLNQTLATMNGAIRGGWNGLKNGSGAMNKLKASAQGVRSGSKQFFPEG